MPLDTERSLALAHGQRLSFRWEERLVKEASHSSIRNEGHLQDFELHRWARSGLCHGTDVFTNSVLALLSTVTQHPMSIAIEQAGSDVVSWPLATEQSLALSAAWDMASA